MVLGFIAIFGLIFGSFLNVVIARLGTEKSIWGARSACPRCGHKIFWYDNIPILSYLILRGHCRHCRKRISLQYILVELGTALIFAWLYLRFGWSIEFFSYLVFASFLIVIFVYDLVHYLILDQVSLPAMVAAVLANWYLGADLKYLFLAGLLGAGFFAIQFFVSQGRWVGGGDIRLGAVMGLMLGWQQLLLALMLAYIVGAVVGLGLIAANKKDLSSKVPFGPFLTLATLVTLLYGQEILTWYLGILN